MLLDSRRLFCYSGHKYAAGLVDTSDSCRLASDAQSQLRPRFRMKALSGGGLGYSEIYYIMRCGAFMWVDPHATAIDNVGA